MSQYQLPNIDPDVNTGTQLSQWLNLWADAVETSQIGAARPAGISAGFMWIQDVSPTEWLLNVYDGTHDIPIATMDPSTGQPVIGGLGTAAYADLTTSASDATPGSVTKTGDFGIGGNAVAVSNFDTLAAGGLYYNPNANAIGAPTAATNYRIYHHNISPNEAAQVALLGTASLSRSKAAGSWSAWSTGWSSANLVKQSSAADGTAGRVLLVGGFGVGSLGVTAADANTIAAGGLYAVGVGAANIPVSENGSITHVQTSATSATQMYVGDVDSKTYVRSKFANVWGAWKQLTVSGGTTAQLNYLQEKVQALGSIGGATSFDTANGAYITASAISACTWTINTTGLTTGWATSFTLALTNGAVGEQTFTGVQWAGGEAPTLSAGTDILVFTRNGTGAIRGALAMGDVA